MQVKGSFSNLTSREFALQYELRYGRAVGLFGAASFTALAVLGEAIERAGSLNTSLVRRALQTSTLSEFYADVAFDEHGQLEETYRILQIRPSDVASNGTRPGGLTLVYNPRDPPSVRGQLISFPQPTWAERTCDQATLACSGRGRCSTRGVCVCDDGYVGQACEATPRDLTVQAVLIGSLTCLLVVAMGLIARCWRRKHGPFQLVITELPSGVCPKFDLAEGERYHLFLSHVRPPWMASHTFGPSPIPHPRWLW